MKKKIFYLSAVICLVSFVTMAKKVSRSCDRDDCPFAQKKEMVQSANAKTDLSLQDSEGNESRLIIKSNP